MWLTSWAGARYRYHNTSSATDMLQDLNWETRVEKDQTPACNDIQDHERPSWHTCRYLLDTSNKPNKSNPLEEAARRIPSSTASSQGHTYVEFTTSLSCWGPWLGTLQTGADISRDGVLVLVLVLVLTQVLFSVLSRTLYLANFMSTCTRTYLSTVAKKLVLMSTLRVLLSTFLNFYQIGKKVNCFSGLPSSV